VHIPCAHIVHSTCTACAQHVPSMCAARTQHVHSTCTACAQHVPSMCPACAHLLDVALQQLDGLAGAQVPQPDETVKAGRGDEGAVGVEGDAVECARVPLLKQGRGRGRGRGKG
jgi:hypothetical protein